LRFGVGGERLRQKVGVPDHKIRAADENVAAERDDDAQRRFVDTRGSPIAATSWRPDGGGQENILRQTGAPWGIFRDFRTGFAARFG
jgi:hypothetical protein